MMRGVQALGALCTAVWAFGTVDRRPQNRLAPASPVSSAGHIPAGDDWVASALRELKEELGLEARPEDLLYLGKRSVKHDGVFHGKPFHNRQISAVFALRCDKRAAEFKIQESEIESVEWADLDDCIEVVRKNALPNCISLSELKWIRKKVWLFPHEFGFDRSP